MFENGTWDKRLSEVQSLQGFGALKYARPKGGFTDLGTTCFLTAPERSLKYLM